MTERPGIRSASRNANKYPLSRGGSWHHVSDYAPDLRSLGWQAIAHQLRIGNNAEAEALAASLRALDEKPVRAVVAA